MNDFAVKLRMNFILILLFLDVVWFGSSLFNIDITLFKKSNFTVPIILHIILFFLLGYKSNGRKRVLVVVLIVCSFLLLIKHSFTPIFDAYSYEHLHIPGRNAEVVVEHRANLIDQGITEYHVYQTKFSGLFLKELTTKELVIEEPHGSYLSQDDIFDYAAPEWTRNTVSFDTYEGKVTLKLN